MSEKEQEEGVMEVTPEEAQKVLAKKRADRIKYVEEGIQHLLAEQNCALDVQMTFSMIDQPRGRIVVIPRD